MTSPSKPQFNLPGDPKAGVQEESLRGALRKAFQEDPASLGFVVQTLLDACKPQLKVKIAGDECVKCGCKHVRYGIVARHKEAVDLTIKLMDQLEGRPGVADGADAGVTVTRVVVGLDG